ncbi:MAG: HEAT repeat domain-containing protein [Armatimonadetes bacterium]|nr:HEAT repeat domain-containing protein [Armatimonadota bacterium]
MKRTGPRLLTWLALVAALVPAVGGAPSPAERRAALIELAAKRPAPIAPIAAALGDENLVVRRTAARLLAGLGQPARAALVAALGNADFLVRRTALSAACEPLTPQCLPYLEQTLKDPEITVRLTAVNLLLALEPRDEAAHKLLDQARSDASAAVRDVAARALWPYHRDTVLLRDRKDWDHEVKVVQTIPLAKAGWRLHTDPLADGHLSKWFATELDDSQWLPIETEQAWEKQGQAYDGTAWYRTSFDRPAKPDLTAVEFHFDGVDECAWVWLNGVYVGQHDVGPDGWDKPFALDITQEARWGQPNQLTVRVYDSAYAGGIWKPVRIEVLK